MVTANEECVNHVMSGFLWRKNKNSGSITEFVLN